MKAIFEMSDLGPLKTRGVSRASQPYNYYFNFFSEFVVVPTTALPWNDRLKQEKFKKMPQGSHDQQKLRTATSDGPASFC